MRYPNIAAVARDILAIQASSVDSEEVFSIARYIVDENRTNPFDESISSSLLVRGCGMLLLSLK